MFGSDKMESDMIESCLKATQHFLLEKTLEEFESLHGIRGKSDGQHLILDYDQIEVKWTEPYGRVCRGLILDARTFDVIGFGLPKFFNHGEFYADEIDWMSSRVFEKIDGTMVNRWWSPHTERFEYSTRYQLPESLVVNTVGTMTWKDLIDECMRNSFTELTSASQPRNETWTFEVCSRHNQVVVRHNELHAKLLAIRNIETLKERSIETSASSTPRAYSFANAAEVAEFANKHPATELEGFVVVDRDFRRVKMKSDQYVQLHRAKDGLQGINNIILLARANDYEEILVHFPEYKPDLDAVAGAIAQVIAHHESVYEKLKGISDQKSFAIAVTSHGLLFPGSLFCMRSGKNKSIRAGFMEMLEPTFCRYFKSAAEEALASLR
jgi:hypothetical protein